MPANSSHYAAVTHVSGIGAGSGGFDIAVGGNTHLIGGVIASRADPSKNSLTTGTLTYEDIRNESSAKASSNRFGSDSSVLSGSKYAIGKTVVGNLMGGGGDSENHSSTTHSAIANGTIAITDEEAQKRLTGKTVEEAMAGISRDASLDRPVLARPDVSKLQANAELEQATNRLTYQVGSRLTDEAYRVIDDSKVYKLTDGCKEASCAETVDPRANFLLAQDGKVHASDNGIFNNASAAIGNAMQNTPEVTDRETGALGKPVTQYVVYYPQASNAASELLVAGYLKAAEWLGFGDNSSATQVNVDLIGRYGQAGLVLDGHSRGSMVVANAMATALNENGPGSAQQLYVNFFGPAANAAHADKNLAQLQNRQLGEDSKELTCSVHRDDFGGRIIGLNPATGGTPSLNADGTPRSAWQEWLNMFSPGPTVHNCYGSGRAGCEVYWPQLKSPEVGR